MHILISTPVQRSHKLVFQGFTQDLFMKLNPPFPKVKLLQFDGCKKGDLVKIELDFIFFRQSWVSQIIEEGADSSEIYFVDRGIRLPFFLKSWQHRHRIVNQGTGTLIIDDIQYSTPFFVMDYLIYPLLYLQFLYRKPIYKRYFS